jgi:hypothetical protein
MWQGIRINPSGVVSINDDYFLRSGVTFQFCIARRKKKTSGTF